jgi:hypothetical protein
MATPAQQGPACLLQLSRGQCFWCPRGECSGALQLQVGPILPLLHVTYSHQTCSTFHVLKPPAGVAVHLSKLVVCIVDIAALKGLVQGLQQALNAYRIVLDSDL